MVGSLDRLEPDPEGRVVVVDLKIAARRHRDSSVWSSKCCAGAFRPIPGWHCKDCPFRSRCWLRR